MAEDTDTRLSVHEAVCAERYNGIQSRFDEGSKRMQKIEYLIYAVMVLVLLGPGVAAELFKKIMGL
jgi:hypothetical protein